MMNDTPTLPARMAHAVETWCAGRCWPGRALLVLWFAWVAWHHAADDMYTSLFGMLNLGIHELGHMVFRPGGEFLHVAGGTILQLLVPLISIVMFLRQRDYFALSLSGVWLSTNLYNVATYMADARVQILPLVTPGGGHAEHDWYHLFIRMGLLSHDTAIAAAVRVAAFIIIWSSIAAGAWMCYLMARGHRRAPVAGA